MPVWLLRRIMPTAEKANWHGFDRYKAAKQKQARSKAQLEAKMKKKRRKGRR